jgi:hypothetical protein
MNRAFFKRVLVTEDGVTDSEFTGTFATVLNVHAAANDARQAWEARRNANSPDGWVGAFVSQSLKEDTLAERGGFEPPDPFGGSPH